MRASTYTQYKWFNGMPSVVPSVVCQDPSHEDLCVRRTLKSILASCTSRPRTLMLTPSSHSLARGSNWFLMGSESGKSHQRSHLRALRLIKQPQSSLASVDPAETREGYLELTSIRVSLVFTYSLARRIFNEHAVVSPRRAISTVCLRASSSVMAQRGTISTASLLHAYPGLQTR